MQEREKPTTKIIRYKHINKLSEKNKFFKKKMKEELLALTSRTLLCMNSLDVDAAVALARALNHSGINSSNYLLFLRFLETNNSHVVKALIGRRNPNLLFSSVKPNWYLVKEAFRILARFSRDEILDKVLLALLGLIQNTYKLSKFGYSIYPLTVADVYSIGKYLEKKKGQSGVHNTLILDLLFDIYQMGIDDRLWKAKSVAIAANNIRMAFFDDMKKMEDVIPNVLLLPDSRNKEIKPKYILQDKGESE
jgi:hypothetical protein